MSPRRHLTAQIGSAQSLRVVLILLWVHEQRLEGGVQRDLQRYLDIHQNHLSMQIGRLKRDRLLTATINPTDGSSRGLHLTAAVRAKLVHALTAGTGNCLPFGCIPDLRYQQVYSASEFSGRLNIKDLTFYNQLFSVGSIDPAHYVVRVSVTAKAPNNLDLTNLDNNVGDDQELFFDGDLSGSLSPTHRLSISGKPYNYDPDDGNLLLEIIKTDGGPDYGTVFLDRFTNDPSIGSSRAHEYGGVIGDPAESYVGLVTTFSGQGPLPEPSSVVLLIAALGASALMARSRITAGRLTE
jgi:DNA-binding MarR family transcriptional regulator